MRWSPGPGDRHRRQRPTIDYDSLGRKTTMVDPVLGQWTYT